VPRKFPEQELRSESHYARRGQIVTLITSEEWYDLSPDLNNFNQGDVIKDVPFFVFPTHHEKFKENKWAVLRPRYMKAGRTFEDTMRQLPADLKATLAKDITTPPLLWASPLGEYILSVVILRPIV
jgi:hypothetical protein